MDKKAVELKFGEPVLETTHDQKQAALDRFVEAVQAGAITDWEGELYAVGPFIHAAETAYAPVDLTLITKVDFSAEMARDLFNLQKEILHDTGVFINAKVEPSEEVPIPTEKEALTIQEELEALEPSYSNASYLADLLLVASKKEFVSKPKQEDLVTKFVSKAGELPPIYETINAQAAHSILDELFELGVDNLPEIVANYSDTIAERNSSIDKLSEEDVRKVIWWSADYNYPSFLLQRDALFKSVDELRAMLKRIPLWEYLLIHKFVLPKPVPEEVKAKMAKVSPEQETEERFRTELREAIEKAERVVRKEKEEVPELTELKQFIEKTYPEITVKKIDCEEYVEITCEVKPEYRIEFLKSEFKTLKAQKTKSAIKKAVSFELDRIRITEKAAFDFLIGKEVFVKPKNKMGKVVTAIGMDQIFIIVDDKYSWYSSADLEIK